MHIAELQGLQPLMMKWTLVSKDQGVLWTMVVMIVTTVMPCMSRKHLIFQM